jgi:hypothetical protein
MQVKKILQLAVVAVFTLNSSAVVMATTIGQGKVSTTSDPSITINTTTPNNEMITITQGCQNYHVKSLRNDGSVETQNTQSCISSGKSTTESSGQISATCSEMVGHYRSNNVSLPFPGQANDIVQVVIEEVDHATSASSPSYSSLSGEVVRCKGYMVMMFDNNGNCMTITPVCYTDFSSLK